MHLRGLLDLVDEWLLSKSPRQIGCDVPLHR